MGISNGLANVLGSSTWAEIYGVRYIGGIKALTTGIMVFSTAFGTAIFGFFIDNDVSIEKIGIWCLFYVIISIILVFLFRNTFEPRVIKT